MIAVANDGILQYFAKIGLDAQDFLNGMSKAQGGVLSFYRDVSVSMAATMLIFDKVMQYGQKFIDLSNQAAEYVSTIDKLAVTTGMSTEELERWANVARYADSDINTLAASINKMQVNLASSGAAGDDARQMLDDMGVSYKNADGSLKSTAELFPDIIQGMKGLESSADRVTAANAIFGRGYQSLAGYMDMSKSEMEEYFSGAAVLTEEGKEELRDYEKAIKDLNASVGGLANTAGAELAPAFGEFAELLNDVSASEGTIEFFSWLNDALTLVARGFHILGSEAMAAWQLINGDVSGAKGTMDDLAKWVLAKSKDDAMKAYGWKTDGMGNAVVDEAAPKADKHLSGAAVADPEEENRIKALKTATDNYTKSVEDLGKAYESLNDINKDYAREMSILNPRDVSAARQLTIRHNWAVEDQQDEIAKAQGIVDEASAPIDALTTRYDGTEIGMTVTVDTSQAEAQIQQFIANPLNPTASPDITGPAAADITPLPSPFISQSMAAGEDMATPDKFTMPQMTLPTGDKYGDVIVNIDGKTLTKVPGVAAGGNNLTPDALAARGVRVG